MSTTSPPSKISQITALAAVSLGIFVTTSALADWRKELGTFRVGMIEAQARQYSPADLDKIRAVYSKALGMPVEIFQAKDFPSLIDAHASSRIEYAFYTAEAFATASLACECVEPLAAPVGADGSIGVRAALIVDSGLALAGLPGSKGIGVPGVNSMSTFGAALASFQPNGVKLTGTEPWLEIEDGMTSAVEEFGAGALDGFFASVSSIQSLSQVMLDGTALSAELAKTGRKAKAVWLSEIIPNGPHSVRKNLAPEAKTILLKVLLDLGAADPELNDLLLPESAASFAAVSQGAYALALDAAQALASTAAAPTP